jgi:hypothetical protein
VSPDSLSKLFHTTGSPCKTKTKQKKTINHKKIGNGKVHQCTSNFPFAGLNATDTSCRTYFGTPTAFSECSCVQKRKRKVSFQFSIVQRKKKKRRRTYSHNGYPRNQISSLKHLQSKYKSESLLFFLLLSLLLLVH